MTERTIIVGASHCGAQLCVSLRQGGWAGEITLIGEETAPPYHRPPLSKDFLLGQKHLSDILIRPEQVGEILSYTKLVLATGARVRKLPIPGADLPSVFYLRDQLDVEAIKQKAMTAKTALIIGGGYIGLETAASLRKLGLDVTVLEAMPRILQRVTSPELSDFFKRVHKEEGTTILENVAASSLQTTHPQTAASGLSVTTQCGQTLTADFVVIGIGVIPNTDLAEAAGLSVGNGIEINEFCQTDDPDIYAAGDVAWHYNPIFGRHLRLESVPNTTDQAKIAAQHINGNPIAQNSVPWFWSDQYDVKLQIAGLSDGYTDIVIRGDHLTSRKFSIFYFKNSALLAVDAVNDPQSFMMGKMALTKNKTVDKTLLANPEQSLKATLI